MVPRVWGWNGVPNPDGPTLYAANGRPKPARMAMRQRAMAPQRRATLGSSTESSPPSAWVKTSTTPVAVYVAWNPNDSLLGGTTGQATPATRFTTAARWWPGDVNQQNTCPNDSPDASDHPWNLLGVYNFTSDTINMKLNDANNNPSSGEMLDFNDVMIRPIWPTVSIRANEDGTGTFSAYDDYLNATNPAEIPVEGSGPRMELDLSASVDPLYAQLGSMSDWNAVLPAVSGLEFWSAATGGTQITSIDDSIPVQRPIRPQGLGFHRPSHAATINVDQIAFTVDPDGAS